MTVNFDTLNNHIENDIHSIIEMEFAENPDELIVSEQAIVKIMPWGMTTLCVPLTNECVIEKTFRFGTIELQDKFVEALKERGTKVMYSNNFPRNRVCSEKLIESLVDSCEDMESFILLDPIYRVEEWVYIETNRQINNETSIKGKQWVVQKGFMLNQCKAAVYELLDAFDDGVKESELVSIVTSVIDKFANDESKCTIKHHDHYGRQFTEVNTGSGITFFLDIVCKKD